MILKIASGLRRRSGKERSRGQSMVEFALIAPTFFLILFGIVEFGILMFCVASSRYAVGEAARNEAQVGANTVKCGLVPGCTRLGGAYVASYDCDADCFAIVAVHNSPVGTTSLETVNFIQVEKMQFVSNNYQAYSPRQYNTYALNGTCSRCPGSAGGYATTNRNMKYGTSDYVQVTINYTYKWKTGTVASLTSQPVLTTSYIIRLEPQTF